MEIGLKYKDDGIQQGEECNHSQNLSTTAGVKATAARSVSSCCLTRRQGWGEFSRSLVDEGVEEAVVVMLSRRSGLRSRKRVNISGDSTCEPELDIERGVQRLGGIPMIDQNALLMHVNGITRIEIFRYLKRGEPWEGKFWIRQRVCHCFCLWPFEWLYVCLSLWQLRASSAFCILFILDIRLFGHHVDRLMRSPTGTRT
eukprot:1339517-Amorphochlora_amoeboformis.AAC.1